MGLPPLHSPTEGDTGSWAGVWGVPEARAETARPTVHGPSRRRPPGGGGLWVGSGGAAVLVNAPESPRPLAGGCGRVKGTESRGGPASKDPAGVAGAELTGQEVFEAGE